MNGRNAAKRHTQERHLHHQPYQRPLEKIIDDPDIQKIPPTIPMVKMIVLFNETMKHHPERRYETYQQKQDYITELMAMGYDVERYR